MVLKKKDQGIRRNANRIYNQYIADGYNAETAFMKTVNGYILQQDKLPTIYDINQVTSIKITDPTDTQVKKVVMRYLMAGVIKFLINTKTVISQSMNLKEILMF